MPKLWFSEVQDGVDWSLSPERSAAVDEFMNVQRALRTVDLSKADIFQVEGHNLVWHDGVLICVGGDGSEVTLSPDGWKQAKAVEGKE